MVALAGIRLKEEHVKKTTDRLTKLRVADRVECAGEKQRTLKPTVYLPSDALRRS